MSKIITKAKPFRASNVFIRREMAAARAMMHKRTPVQTWGDPQIEPLHKGQVSRWSVAPSLLPWQEKANARHRDRVNYAASLGRKRGLLPLDLSAWEAKHCGAAVGDIEILFYPPRGEVVAIELHWLEWVPNDPVVEHDTPTACCHEGVFA